VTRRHWHILGAGAVGCLFAHAMADASIPCTLIRKHAAQPHCLLQVQNHTGESRVKIPCETAAPSTPVEYLLVTTKAYDVEVALRSIRHRLAENAIVLLLVNGMGLAEQAATLLPDKRIFCGITTEGAYRRGPLDICHAGHGITRIGALQAQAEPEWFAPWRALHLQCQWEKQIGPALWHKLAINCAINPLTAVHGCRNGELGKNAKLRAEVQALCGEIAAVSRAMDYTQTANTIDEDVARVIRDTADNRSSMLQDVQAGRQTEIDFITGYLVSRAAALNLPVPHNETLLRRISDDNT
jgi:2-dehydropantoate 2-reductase